MRGALVTSKTTDAQAAYETIGMMSPVVLAHTHFVLRSSGWLEGSLTASYKQYLMDAEMLAIISHFFQDFEINEEISALDMIALVGPGGHHFGTPHTQARNTNAFSEAALSDRQSYDAWMGLSALRTLPTPTRFGRICSPPTSRHTSIPGLSRACESSLRNAAGKLAGKYLYD